MRNKFFLLFTAFVSLTTTVCCGKNSSQAQKKENITPLKKEDIVFANAFEDGDLKIWDDWDKNPAPHNVVVQDSGPFNRSGNHALRLRVPPGRGGADVVKVLPQKYDKLYARWYVKWEPGYDFKARNHGGGLFAGDRNLHGSAGMRPKGDDKMGFGFEPDAKVGRPFLYAYYRGMYQDCADPNGSCYGDHFPCFTDSGRTYCTYPDHRPRNGKQTPLLITGKWYCVETMVDMGTASGNAENASGILNLWIDGEEYGPWNKLWLRTTPDLKLTIFNVSLFHHAEHSVEGMIVDNIVVATKRIGMGPVISE